MKPVLALVLTAAIPALAACAAALPQEAAPATSGPLADYAMIESRAAENENVVYSPVSTAQAMGLVQLGARGETASQIEQVLGIAPAEPGARALADTRRALMRKSDGVEVRIANALFLSARWRFAATYRAAARDIAGAEAASVDFAGDPAGAAAAMNGWASAATGGEIPVVVAPETVNRGAAAYLANATFFEGQWVNPFGALATRPFLFGDGQEREFVLMEGRLSLAYAAEGDWRAVRLPYGSPSSTGPARFVMDVMIPTARTATLPPLGGTRIDSLGRALGEARPRNVHVWMPQFEAEVRQDLVAPLGALGLTLPFDRSAADLSGLSEPGQARLFIDEAFQVARVKVDQKGTRAAAVTMAVPTPVSVPPPFDGIDFTVDRPFVFAIRDLETGTVLFVGRISAPHQVNL